MADLPPDGRENEWNSLEVRCVGPSVTTTLNGRRAGETSEAPTDGGFIGLATQGCDFEFRNIRLVPFE